MSRIVAANGPLRVRTIAGSQVVLMAPDIMPEAQKGLRGFAFQVSHSGRPAAGSKAQKYRP